MEFLIGLVVLALFCQVAASCAQVEELERIRKRLPKTKRK